MSLLPTLLFTWTSAQPNVPIRESSLVVTLDKTVHLEINGVTAGDFSNGVYSLKRVGGDQGNDYIFDFRYVDGDFETLRFTSSDTFTTLFEGRTATYVRAGAFLDIRYEIHGNSQPSDISSVDMSVRCQRVCHARPFTVRFSISRSPVRGVYDVTEDSVHEVEKLKDTLRRVCWIPTAPDDFLKVGSIIDEVVALDLRGEEIYLTAS
ncbi:hypothetical protein FOZ63_029367 [Perkinsus olseni]|uniref:Uncharacterized protein n=1 Tax=Perkinsus olseni TaxID=32597 RepID=A0A7J6UK39_PEROL|nr:hypothetical protein FOZ63_029367 [Perkinsus olseni]